MANLFSPENGEYLSRFIQGLLGIGETDVAFLNAENWMAALGLTLETLVMSIMAIGFAAVGMFIFIFFGAKNRANGTLTLKKRWYYKPVYYLTHFIFLTSRALPELMWAMILIYIFKLGILPGALALAIHNFGILGKLCTEVIENMNEKPIQSIALTGGTEGQLILYGILPETATTIMNYILYRFENIIRATLIIGMVGAGGLGMQFRLAMSFFNYSEITLYLLCYLILVYLTDFISSSVKRFLNS